MNVDDSAFVAKTNADSETSKKSSSFLKKFLNFILYLAVVLLIALSVPRILLWSLGTPYPMAGISSQSMWPELKRGDLVLVKKVGLDTISKGNVIVYKRDNIFIIHRVINKKNNILKFY